VAVWSDSLLVGCDTRVEQIPCITSGCVRSNTARILRNCQVPDCRSTLVAHLCQALLGTLSAALGQGSDCVVETDQVCRQARNGPAERTPPDSRQNAIQDA
jgi:hypothetical protein